MKAMLAKKIGMSQVFSSTGEVIPVTLVLAQPNAVTLRRSQEKDGHIRVQLSLVKKPKSDKFVRREFAAEVPAEATEVTLEQFTVGDVVEVSGVSKGKGFQGVVRRHHFKGGPGSHGHTDWTRKAGSIGSRFPQHTRKGKRMAGRMGGDRVTVKNLEVVMIDTDKQLLAIKGAIPGIRGAIVEIVTAA
jgi:large subunit ribosomal protein L3